MLPTQKGSLRLFQVAGITVYLHWLWFVVAAWEIFDPLSRYHSVLWNALEYLALFGIVLLHEFGHALACRSVGGRAERIVLWPLGGVAYVQPPQRPGAMLWSIAAGPLVNVVLLVVLTAVGQPLGLWAPQDNLQKWFQSLWFINFALLAFNLLPIYPLDGGQILRSLLWFLFGRARSLMVASVIGFVGVIGMVALALLAQRVWFGILGVFIALNCWRGLQAARAMAKIDALPQREGYRCPDCQSAPPAGALWKCNQCGTAFDTFVTHATCPQCAQQFPVTRCVQCGGIYPLDAWLIPPPAIVDPSNG